MYIIYILSDMMENNIHVQNQQPVYIEHLLKRPWGLRWSFPGSPAEAPRFAAQDFKIFQPRGLVVFGTI